MVKSSDLGRPRLEKSYLAVAAILAWSGIVVQAVSLARTQSLVSATWRLVGYLTILTNVFVAYFFTIRLLRSGSRRAWPNRPSPATWITVSITFVGIAFAGLLSRLYHPVGLDWWANLLLHYVTPAFGIVYWLTFLRFGTLKWTDPLMWSIYAIVYAVYAMIRGAMSGWYPYPFLDLPVVGIRSVVVHVIALYILFCVLGSIFVFIGRTWPIGSRADEVA